MKLLTLSTLVVGMYQNPTYALLIAIGLVFLIDLIQKLSNKNNVSESNYEAIKELFKQYDDICSKDIYSEEEKSQVVIETQKTISTKLEVVPVNISLFSYRELQTIAKALNISGRNRKRVVLEQELLALCK